jgi:hypothetical protein
LSTASRSLRTLTSCKSSLPQGRSFSNKMSSNLMNTNRVNKPGADAASRLPSVFLRPWLRTTHAGRSTSAPIRVIRTTTARNRTFSRGFSRHFSSLGTEQNITTDYTDYTDKDRNKKSVCSVKSVVKTNRLPYTSAPD